MLLHFGHNLGGDTNHDSLFGRRLLCISLEHLYKIQSPNKYIHMRKLVDLSPLINQCSFLLLSVELATKYTQL